MRRFFILLFIPASLLFSADTDTAMPRQQVAVTAYSAPSPAPRKKTSKKPKAVKKKSATYRYNRYLDALSSRHPIGHAGYEYAFGAEFNYDVGYVDQTPPAFFEEPTSYFNNKVRRFRINHKGSFYDRKLFYQIEYSFTGNNHYKDNYIGYQDRLGSLPLSYRLQGGNTKIPYSLQRFSALKNLTFMERPLGDDAFSVRRKLGAVLFLRSTLQKQHFLGLSIAAFTNSIDERLDGDRDEQGYALRATYTYRHKKRNLFHIGAGSITENLHGKELHYKQGCESKVVGEKYVSTRIDDVEHRRNDYLDLLYLNQKFAIEAGYTVSTVTANDTYIFSSHFLEGSYFIIGRGKRFNAKASKFSRVKPTHDGAIEVALRYSHIDLNSKDEHGGRQSDYNVALNWYVTKELRVMTNYIYAMPDDTDEYDGALNILQARLQIAF